VDLVAAGARRETLEPEELLEGRPAGVLRRLARSRKGTVGLAVLALLGE